MSAPLNWHKWLVLSLLGLALSAQPIGCDYGSITDEFGAEAVARCNEKCPFQNRTGDGHFDVSCGSDCSVQQCKIGCSVWKLGLIDSCQAVCNVTSETVFSRELYCVMGCNEALNYYFQKLRELIGTPNAPALVADSLTATSLSLFWEAPNLGNINYLVQWRYEELPGTWQYYSNSSHSNRSIIHVENLQPYTKYRFRVAIFLSGRVGTGEPVYSAPSVVISTLESGKPNSMPAALRVAAPDPTRVAVSWEPGQFPNGPLISYVLRLTDTQPNTIDALEEMPASNNSLFYMFQNLAPAREYEVSIAMRNAAGVGPEASVKISTPPLPMSVPSQQPILILGGEQNVLAAAANDMLSDPIELYNTEHKITGVGLDVSSDSLFVSISNRYVYRSSLSRKNTPEAILTPHNISYQPLDLSVDWLNRHLYVLGQVYYRRDDGNSSVTYPNWEILRYDFDGKNQVVALSGYFHSRPIHFEVDAYNGYLFWALRGSDRGGGGLYRLDLANISNGVRHDAPPELIVRDPHLGAFTVDHADFRLLVVHLLNNTVLSVSLDGREVTDFRRNTQKPMFQSTRSIAYAGGLFYWTNGREMLTEEYHGQSDSFFHNEYPLPKTRIVQTSQVLVALNSCQPIPVPVNPPLGVQSVMGVDRAKVSWSPPHLLGHQGTGAWQQWTFHLQLTHQARGETIDIKDIVESSYTVNNLEHDTDYTFRVAAITKSGSGPWSSEFVGKTLAATATTRSSTLVWSGPDGLLQTDLTGENLKTLIDKTDLKNVYITDISWYRDKLYLVTNASTVMWFNITSLEKGLMPNMENVGSLAVDWVGKKIYWSNPKQQLITRGNFDGSNREPVPIVTVAKELTIDSLGAYIYWNTGHAVEAARLNGENKIVYYPAQLFSGKQVMGLTTDLENKWLYWMVRSYDGSELHRAPTADQISHGVYEISGSLVKNLQDIAMLGPLCYFSGRLVWIQDASRAVVSDLAGEYTADLVPRVHNVAVRNPALHDDSESLIAIPEMINSSSIVVLGVWNNFNVTWAPATRVNINGSRVYYDVSLHFHGQYKIERTVEVPWVEVQERTVAPYSTMDVTVRAHTHWGGGAAARAQLRSPQAMPSAPRKPRVYMQHVQSDGPLTATFRWEPPSHPNGIIRGYEVQCWSHFVRDSGHEDPVKASACADAHLSPTHTQLMLKELINGSMYYFRVRSYTDAGVGQYSLTVSSSSDDVNPIPKVMMSSQESLKIMDLDSGERELIPKSTGIPIDFTVSIEENVVYWVNQMEEIFSSRMNGSGNYKLASVTGSATSICLDWVGRSVYWTQLEMSSIQSYVVYRADLSVTNTPPQIRKVFARRQPIYSLQIAPLKRTLYWYEASIHPELGNLITSKIDGTKVRNFFNRTTDDEEPRDDCNCPENPQVAKSFVIDMTTANYQLYWVDPWVKQIVAADMEGCKCRVVGNATGKYGFVPSSIAVDSKYIYWFNSTERIIYYTSKNNITKVEQVKASHGHKIVALDPRNQMYPSRNCLYPETQSLRPQMIATSANSITLQLPTVGKPKTCRDLQYEMPAIEYTVYYYIQQYKDSIGCDRVSCNFVTTTTTQVTLSELKPFTNYTVITEATNYYAKLHEVEPLTGPTAVFHTASEAPKAPKDVKYTVLSPVLARVEWTPEPGRWYELHWGTDDTPSLSLKFKEHNTFVVTEGRSANMTRLSPSTLYTVWVRARSNYSAVWADSKSLTLRTYPLPAPLAIKNITAYSIQLYWPPPTSYQLHQYKMEYSSDVDARASNDNWKHCAHNGGGEWTASKLSPKTRYRFRLRLQYVANGPFFAWPNDDSYIYETLGDIPAAPGQLRIEAVGDRVLRVWWTEPDSRGAPIEEYRVWGRLRHKSTNHNSTKNMSDLMTIDSLADVDRDSKMMIMREGLELLHNGSEAYWLIGAGAVSEGYVARVQARNSYGWSRLSPAAELDVAPLAYVSAPHPAALAVAVAALAALVLCVAAAVFYTYNNRTKKEIIVETQLTTNSHRRGPDVELATLRQLPIRHSTNILYNQGVHCPSDAELASLPHIRREQITLTKFLGSGAFGEVFEGVARQINGTTTENMVAVKTLRKGATEQEKAEFLKEAALMSNFKHDHILRLLGVCLDNDPNYIIMELMEGGDLLSYLRDKRSSLYTPESLNLLDLLNMCVDVTKGCRYLEEMHFVHRDLACRNCLVAHRANGRIVKIGDFGLARDIYKNDYYRKEGEGLLPVRWMAVECLVDGVFSCQSDVWAWAVLCWEVLSLGQQPYPARTNRQVLGYVRAGGTPDRPPNCPSDFYDLLQKCWSYSADARPSFRHCLEVVTALRDKTSPNITLTATPAAAAAHYLTLLGDDEDNPELEMEPSHLLPQRALKYSELTYDSDSGGGTVYDGYEIPRAPTSFMPFSRHSIVGVAPNRLIKPPIYRTHSLRHTRPPNATIIPLRNGLVKRASLCEEIQSSFMHEPRPNSSREHPIERDKHTFKTPF